MQFTAHTQLFRAQCLISDERSKVLRRRNVVVEGLHKTSAQSGSGLAEACRWEKTLAGRAATGYGWIYATAVPVKGAVILTELPPATVPPTTV